MVVVDCCKMSLFTIFPIHRKFCTGAARAASYFFTLVVILQSHDTIGKRKWMNTMGDIRRSATILYRQKDFARVSHFLHLVLFENVSLVISHVKSHTTFQLPIGNKKKKRKKKWRGVAFTLVSTPYKQQLDTAYPNMNTLYPSFGDSCWCPENPKFPNSHARLV